MNPVPEQFQSNEHQKDRQLGRLVRTFYAKWVVRATFCALCIAIAAVSPAAAQDVPEPDQAEPAKAEPAKTEPAKAESPKPIVVAPDVPEFAVVKAAVEKYFATQTNYQDGDLIRQSQATGALAAVKDTGWEVPDREALLKRVLPDGSFLVKELSTTTGRAFMRRIGKHGGGYTRLDRLSTISGGEQLVRDLAHQKDGDKLIEYMATTAGGHNMGRMAAGTKNGVDLNKPTGRIYTAGELITELERAYRTKDAKKAATTK